MVPTTQQLISLISQGYYAFIHSNPLQIYGLWGILIVGLVPSFVLFVPDESVIIPVYLAHPTKDYALQMFIIYGIGVTLSNVLIFFTAHHLTNILRKEKRKATEARNMFHKYRIPVFLIAPSLIFGIGDLITIIAGIKHTHFIALAPYLILGCFIRAAWGIMIAVYGISLFQ